MGDGMTTVSEILGAGPLTDQVVDRRQSDLHRCEEVIGRGLQTFIEVGDALARIHDQRLYRESYSTFEDYCRERWGFSRRTGYDLMQTAGVARTVQEVAHAKVTREQARELVPLKGEPEQLRGALAEVHELHGDRPTAKQVSEVVGRHRIEPASEEEREVLDPGAEPYPYAVGLHVLPAPWPPVNGEGYCEASDAEKAITNIVDKHWMFWQDPEELPSALDEAVRELGSQPSCADLLVELRTLKDEAQRFKASGEGLRRAIGDLGGRLIAKFDDRRLDELSQDDPFLADAVRGGAA